MRFSVKRPYIEILKMTFRLQSDYPSDELQLTIAIFGSAVSIIHTVHQQHSKLHVFHCAALCLTLTSERFFPNGSI